MPAMNPKQRAADAALKYVRDGMTVGLGTGSTADFFLKALGAAIKNGSIRDIRGLPTSIQSERRAREVGIPLTTFDESHKADITIDGADEVDDHLNLIKGLGGALLREKIVAQNSHSLIIIADASKRVSRLGTHAPLPVEVAQFGYECHARFLASLGCKPALRILSDGMVMRTDNGNVIYDCRFESITEPRELERALKSRAGVVETGLFLDLATVALIGTEERVDVIERKPTQ